MASRVGRALISAVRNREQELALALVGVALAFTVALPLAAPLASVGSNGGAEIRALRELVVNGRLWFLLWRSTWLSVAVAVGSLALGLPIGVLLGRTDVVGRRALSLGLALPVSLPPFLIALGWYYVWGRSGWVGSETTAAWLFSDAGVVGVLSLTFAPVGVALTALGAGGVHSSLEDAARVVASPTRILVRIVTPAIWPSIALAAIIVFALAFSELGVPMFLRRDVYPAAVFARLGGADYQPSEALVLALPLLPVAGLLLALERAIFRKRSFAVLGASRSVAKPMPLGVWRWPVSAGCWVIGALAMAPIASLTGKAGLAGLAGASSVVTASLSNSLVTSLLTAVVITILAAVLGHAIARRARGSTMLDGLSMLAFVTPAAVLGTGLMAVYNRPLTGWLYGSLAIVVVGFVARYSIVGVRAMAVAVAQSSRSFEESASAFGARYGRRFFAIVLPMHRRALVGAAAVTFIFCLRDLETAVLVYPPGGEPLTVRIFTFEANGPPPIVAGLAVVQAMTTLAVLVIAARLVAPKARS